MSASPLTEPRPALSPRSRLRGLDPLVPLTAVVALAVYVTHGFDGGLTRDLGVYAYGGQQVAEGVPPYVAIVNRAGPLAHFLPGIGAWVARLVGVDDVLGMRVFFLLIAVACVVVTYLLARDVFRSRATGVVAAAALLSVRGFVIYATYGPREKTPLVLFCALALLAVVHRRWATAGFCIALATLTWQPAFFALGAGAAVAALLQAERRLGSLVRIAVGGLAPLLAVVAAYAVVGDLKFFIDDFVLVNARYTEQVSLMTEPRIIWEATKEIYGWTTWLLIGGLVAVVLQALASVRSALRHDPRAAALVGMGVLAIVGALWSLKAYNGWPDCFFVFPVVMVGIGGLAPLLGRLLPRPALVALVAVWAVVSVVITTTYAVTTRNHDLDEQRRDVEAVQRVLPDARIMSLEAPPALVLAHQRNPTRFQLFGNGLTGYLDDVWPGGREGYARWVARRAPELLAVGTESGHRSWLEGVLQRDFVLVGESPEWDWYVRPEVGPDRVEELRRVLRD
ncbi:ArnT family glycosyltransferase [Nocardioides sp. MAHUQ-72]|uniref:ArnT family glycosyltransferase n=1 Tax=unclassified Nocardioides TaxID=2615069 RepID=UPI00360FA2B7